MLSLIRNNKNNRNEVAVREEGVEEWFFLGFSGVEMSENGYLLYTDYSDFQISVNKTNGNPYVLLNGEYVDDCRFDDAVAIYQECECIFWQKVISEGRLSEMLDKVPEGILWYLLDPSLKMTETERCKVASLLLEAAGICPNFVDKDANYQGEQLLTQAIKFGWFELAKLFLQYGADPDGDYDADINAKIPLVVAIEKNALELCYELVRKGADLDAQEHGEYKWNVFGHILHAAENRGREWQELLCTMVECGMEPQRFTKYWNHGRWYESWTDFADYTCGLLPEFQVDQYFLMERAVIIEEREPVC